MARRVADLSAGQVVSGRYRLGEEIGRGGMARVFAATDRDLDRPVALKVLQPSLADSATIRRRFIREAQAAAKLTSDHVVRVFDVGSLDDGQLWIVMERLEGRDLRQRMTLGRLSRSEAVDAVLQACVALAEAHAAGLVHRDLKPSNMFVTTAPDGTSRLKVLDFGIAKARRRDEDAGLTSTNELLGSPRYMSPEQLRGASRVDARSDVWALGVILYELLMTKPPFPGTSVAELHVAILERAPEPLDEELPLELRHVVLRCLEKDAERRFGDVVSLAEALAPFGSDRAPSLVRAARGYAQRTDDLVRVTEPELHAAEPIESVVETSAPPAEEPRPAPPPVGLETDPTWDASATPAHRVRTGWFVFGAVVALTSTLLVVTTLVSDESAGGAAPLVPGSAGPVEVAPVVDTEPVVTASAKVTASASATSTATASASAPEAAPPSRTRSVAPRPVAPRPIDPVPSLYDDRE